MSKEHLYVQTIHGRLAVPSQEDLISKFLEVFGEWAPYEHTLADMFLNDGDTLVDAGAFIGTFALGCNNAKSLKKTICVEANSLVQPLLELNLEKNCPSPYEVIKMAIGAGSDDVHMRVNFKNLGASSVVPSSESTDGGVVLATSLKEIRKIHGDYQMLKLDIEGSELTALKQDKSYLNAAKPVLFIEANETMKTCQVANYCRWLGYKVFYFSLPVFRTDNHNKSQKRIFQLAHEALLVMLPPSTFFDGPPVSIINDGGFCVEICNSKALIKALWETPRWANKAWMDMNKEQLIALLGRYQKNESFNDFMAQLMPEKPFG
ncbi:FkbM family methyltransferase [Hellea sp.]|nr:FkbM family methyltransferase [Hellea sp.]MDC1088168.1 FkbM family methyltransferase [Hellea sp.]